MHRFSELGHAGIICTFLKIKSTQHKKLAPNALQFTYTGGQYVRVDKPFY